MSLNVSLHAVRKTEVFECNMTHNLGAMAQFAGVYQHLWRPEELNITHAKELIEPLEKGLKKLLNNPDSAKEHNPPNGWGDYNCLVEFIEQYLEACKENPDAELSISR